MLIFCGYWLSILYFLVEELGFMKCFAHNSPYPSAWLANEFRGFCVHVHLLVTVQSDTVFLILHILADLPPRRVVEFQIWHSHTQRGPPGWPGWQTAPLFRQFTGAALWRGQKCCTLTPGANLWALSQNRWKNTKHISGAGVLKFTTTRPLLDVSTAPWLSACSGTSMPWKCDFLRVSGPLPGLKNFQKFFRLWTRWQALLAKNLLLPSKKKLFMQHLISGLFWESENLIPSLVRVHYLYQPGELEGGIKRATDPIWSLKVYSIERYFTKPQQPVLYYLHDGPKRGFVREELLVVPPNTQLPPEQIWKFSIYLSKFNIC